MKFNLQTYFRKFPRWMRPYVYRWCVINEIQPGESATRYMFYLAAKQSDHPELVAFCTLYEATQRELEESRNAHEREITEIAKVLRKITIETKTESNV